MTDLVYPRIAEISVRHRVAGQGECRCDNCCDTIQVGDVCHVVTVMFCEVEGGMCTVCNWCVTQNKLKIKKLAKAAR